MPIATHNDAEVLHAPNFALVNIFLFHWTLAKMTECGISA